MTNVIGTKLTRQLVIHVDDAILNNVNNPFLYRIGLRTYLKKKKLFVLFEN